MREHRFLCLRIKFSGEYLDLRRGEVTGELIKLHSEEFYNLCFSPDIAERED
jgi:hypothetical protein